MRHASSHASCLAHPRGALGRGDRRSVGSGASVVVLAMLFVALTAAPALGQEASPGPASTPPASAQQTPGAEGPPEPELTWAPLVTLPPIAEPPILTPTEQADGFAVGASDAPVVVEVWEDFQCPFCQRFTFQVEPQIVEVYVNTGKARLVFRNLAFLGDESHWAAVAASLAADQDRFWPFHDYLFANLQGENVGSYSLDRLLEIGRAAGLDMDEFMTGLQLDAARERFAAIDDEARRDAGALGIGATPTVVVAGVPLDSPDFATVSAAIDVALAGASQKLEVGGEASPDPGTDDEGG